MENHTHGNGRLKRLRDRRFLTAAAFAVALGVVFAVAASQQGLTPRVAAIGGARTTAIALVIVVIASQFYGSWFPELDRFAQSERRAALRAATPYRPLIGYVVVFVSLSWFAIPILKWLQAYGGTTALVVGLAATWTAPVLLAVWVVRKPIRRGLRRQLAERGLPICERCGYDTRVHTEPRCPECGHPLPELNKP